VSASEDQSDVDKVLAGDVASFEGIVRRWQGPLVNLAYRFTRDRARAEEMAQEAFLRAYRSLGGWRGEAAFSTWLFSLAMNLYRSELRRMPVIPVRLDRIAELRDARAPDGGLHDSGREQIVRRAVALLPPKYKEATILYYFHEMDVETTARTLGVPGGTVKARLARARKILRGKLESFGIGRLLKEAL
jgi:RNA polymerase sigma-70 factor (ECF subfamily)